MATGLLAHLYRGSSRRSAFQFFKASPELIPLFVAVGGGLAYGGWKIYDKTIYDPHLRLRPNHGLDHDSWNQRI